MRTDEKLLEVPIENTLSQLTQTIRFLAANDYLRGVERFAGEAEEGERERNRIVVVEPTEDSGSSLAAEVTETAKDVEVMEATEAAAVTAPTEPTSTETAKAAEATEPTSTETVNAVEATDAQRDDEMKEAEKAMVTAVPTEAAEATDPAAKTDENQA